MPFARPRLRAETGSQAVFVVGDVHGRLDLLLALERKIAADPMSAGAWIILVGDLIDRGPQSAQVIEHAMARQAADERYVVLCGNHEQIMLAAFENADAARLWLSQGGDETLHSYGARDVTSPASWRAHVPVGQLKWLNELPLAFETERYFVSHAGVKAGTSLAEQDDDDLVWIRHDLGAGYDGFDKTIIHGHQVVPEVTLRPGRIAIDTGAYATGRLSAVRLEGDAAPTVLTATASETRRSTHRTHAREIGI